MWNKLFGQKKSEQAGRKELRKLVEAYLGAKGYQDQQHIVEQHPELLGAQADSVFQDLINAESNPTMRNHVWDQYTILIRCRELGVSAAFSERMQGAQALIQQIPHDLLERLLAAVQAADVDAIYALLEEHPELKQVLDGWRPFPPPDR
jgi:2-oxo-4-hydroxy-4-carboxy--5-ureidoimidazoline (OHCU) decarboxylase